MPFGITIGPGLKIVNIVRVVIHQEHEQRLVPSTVLFQEGQCLVCGIRVDPLLTIIASSLHIPARVAGFIITEMPFAHKARHVAAILHTSGDRRQCQFCAAR